MKHHFFKVCSATPKLRLGDCPTNIQEIITCCTEAASQGAGLIVFPELCTTGYTCGDLFYQSTLLEAAEHGIIKLLESTKHLELLIIVGAPIMHSGRLYNTALVLLKGKILGIIPKTYLPNYSEFYEKRWFSSAFDLTDYELTYAGQTVPISSHLLFKADNILYLTLGVEVCEDLWATVPPSLFHALKGATLLANLSASNETVNKAQYRASLVSEHSIKTISAYIYASSSVTESTTDLVFSGQSLIYEDGTRLAESDLFPRENHLAYGIVDLEKLYKNRIRKNYSMPHAILTNLNYKTIYFKLQESDAPFDRAIKPHPFVPSDEATRNMRCKNIFAIQTHGLARRIAHTKAKHFVIGISGGLDSTLALLVCVKAAKLLKMPMTSIIGVTMPGFGTTDRTYQNAINLMKLLGITQKEVSIVEATTLHLKALGHNLTDHDATYENAQARERTQILMDLANQTNGLVIGTGDLSELALGWATYNGDQMSMYGVNTSIPKTLVRYLIEYVAYYESEPLIQEILFDILDTPVSPELLPPSESGDIVQKTEDLVGPYELHDFYIYEMLRFGYSPSKIYFLAQQAFKGRYDNRTLLKWLGVFYKRFFSQQFKRSALPDGPKVGPVALSPRGDLRMPSDADSRMWLEEVNKLINELP